MRRLLRLYCCTPLALFIATPAAAENLIKNGSFESPVVPEGGSKVFGNGDRIGKWVVETEPGVEVALVSGKLKKDIYSFPARDGAQWFDIAGGEATGSASTISQTVKTKRNATYRLSFWAGNVTGGDYAFASSVLCNVDSASLLWSFNRVQGAKQNWQQFTATFVATRTETEITFFNFDNDAHNGIDDVSLTLVEPAK